MDFLIRRKVLISMVFIAMTMLGVVSYNKLQMELYPVPEMPTMVVMVGTSIEVDPEYMENQAIIPVEGAIGTLDGVEEITSMANGRNGTIQISYNEKTNLKFAQLRLQEKMNEVKASLPEGFTINVNRVDTRSMANQFMSIQVLGEGGEDRLRNVADRQISDKLLNVDGVASVSVFGGREKTVRIELTPDVADAYRLTPARIQRMLSSGQVERTYAGDAYHGNTRYYVNMSAEFDDISEIGNVMVDAQTGIRLKDIASHFVWHQRRNVVQPRERHGRHQHYVGERQYHQFDRPVAPYTRRGRRFERRTAICGRFAYHSKRFGQNNGKQHRPNYQPGSYGRTFGRAHFVVFPKQFAIGFGSGTVHSHFGFRSVQPVLCFRNQH
jgi:Cu/Ag efflux pump CusA